MWFPVRLGKHQGCIWGSDFHNGKRLTLFLEAEVTKLRARPCKA